MTKKSSTQANKLWSESNKTPTSLDKNIHKFLAGEDIILDKDIFLFDIEASKAHAESLYRIDILKKHESIALVSQLDYLAKEFLKGDFVLDVSFEDGHSAIEHYLTAKLGELGKKIHTGRSRNDQVLAATRLYIKYQLEQLIDLNKQIAEAFLSQAKANLNIPMPGYTHLQRAVVSSWGLWFASFTESFIDNAAIANQVKKWIDCNPLGTAAGYGVNLALDREFTTESLGFSRLQINPIYAQNSRGKFELEVFSAFKQSLLDARKIAWDLSLFSMSELDFIQLPDSYTTGSSIMPNKRNPDVIELIRASYSKLVGAYNELESLLSLPSGYHRDLQFSKGPLLRGIESSFEALNLLPQLIADLTIDKTKCEQAIDSPMHATDKSIELAKQGVPFRDAYMQLKSGFEELAHRKPCESIEHRVSAGACGNLMLDTLEKRLAEI